MEGIRAVVRLRVSFFFIKNKLFLFNFKTKVDKSKRFSESKKFKADYHPKCSCLSLEWTELEKFKWIFMQNFPYATLKK